MRVVLVTAAVNGWELWPTDVEYVYFQANFVENIYIERSEDDTGSWKRP